MNFFNTLNHTLLRASDILLLISGKENKYFIENAGKACFKTIFIPAELDKSLYAGIIHARGMYNSATETNEIYSF
jgi:hypothetical protein